MNSMDSRPVQSASVSNAVLDGTDGLHQAGENAFTPYVIHTIEANGHAHQIGILGLENCDITRWDLPSHYPGIVFAHPGNDEWSTAASATPMSPWPSVSIRKHPGCAPGSGSPALYRPLPGGRKHGAGQ